ncbi:MAG: putative ABC transporter permease [Eubacteriaceae bacterium]|nr:putative ABC transporter permease [Eubacteriaceae bacterium]
MRKHIADNKNAILVIVLLFLMGGISGFIYEELFYRIDLGYFVKRGTTFGPWIPIYGFGFLLIAFSTEKWRNNPGIVFILSMVVAGTLEFVTGYLLFHYAGGLRLWDYNTEIWNWFNIGGFVCLRSVLCFGIAGLMMQYLIHPVLRKIVDESRYRVIRNVLLVLSAAFIFDAIISNLL